MKEQRRRIKSSTITTVNVSRAFPITVETLWRAAGHPVLLSKYVPMLARFAAPIRLRVGAKVAEIHTILGVPQRYLGRIFAYEEGQEWGMTNEPQGKGLFPLSHQVRYRFIALSSGESSLHVSCDFTCGGLLRFPGVRLLVECCMKYTLNRLLTSLAHQLSVKNPAAKTSLQPA